MRFLRAPRPLLFSLGLVALASPAMAADTTTFNVRIIITKACTITAAAATDVDFGTALSTATTPSNAQGSVTAQCSALTPYTIALNAGSNAATANDVTTRRMRNTDAAVTTNNFVGYQLYQDAGRTNVWGATTATNTVAAVGNGAPQPYNVYGRVLNPSVNNAAAGSYLDTVTATITY
jgi:spore coat protein U-like protein